MISVEPMLVENCMYISSKFMAKVKNSRTTMKRKWRNWLDTINLVKSSMKSMVKEFIHKDCY